MTLITHQDLWVFDGIVTAVKKSRLLWGRTRDKSTAMYRPPYNETLDKKAVVQETWYKNRTGVNTSCPLKKIRQGNLALFRLFSLLLILQFPLFGCFAFGCNFFTDENRKLSATFIYKSSNISKTTATNQCKRVPDLKRPGSVRIKRYCAKTVD